MLELFREPAEKAAERVYRVCGGMEERAKEMGQGSYMMVKNLTFGLHYLGFCAYPESIPLLFVSKISIFLLIGYLRN